MSDDLDRLEALAKAVMPDAPTLDSGRLLACEAIERGERIERGEA